MGLNQNPNTGRNQVTQTFQLDGQHNIGVKILLLLINNNTKIRLAGLSLIIRIIISFSFSSIITTTKPQLTLW